MPAHRVMSLTGAIEGRYPTEYQHENLYRAGFMPVLLMIPVGPLLGLARGALDCFGEQMPSRGIIYTSL